MDLGAHALAQRGIHDLMLLNARFAAEGGADEHRLEVMPIPLHLQMLAGEAFGDPALDLFGIDQLARASVWCLP